ncbi:Hypothetical protein Minf_0741 [Methylacidiphilum infernorum V4]|uniref:Uncharacterized protein n=1 Tax=Methylacidiphilum infernorum (isolate V4) TaxID=481448 RepID=B3E0P2_METI4|nr:Hypothetical protein Minf_0741 [Methylacidiphilum infernorum V4]
MFPSREVFSANHRNKQKPIDLHNGCKEKGSCDLLFVGIEPIPGITRDNPGIGQD